MVGGALALALIAVDVGIGYGTCEGRVRVHEVDAHAPAPMQRTIAVVPEGVRIALERSGHDVSEAELTKVSEGLALWFGHMRAALEDADIPDVVVSRGDIEVADDRERTGRLGGQLCPDRGPQRREPFELVSVMVMPGLTSVRDVDTPHSDAATGCADGTRLVGALVLGLPREAVRDLVEANAAEEGNSIPAPGAQGCDLVAEGLDGHRRKCCVRALQLLKRDHIGLSELKPREQSVKPRRD